MRLMRNRRKLFILGVLLNHGNTANILDEEYGLWRGGYEVYILRSVGVEAEMAHMLCDTL